MTTTTEATGVGSGASGRDSHDTVLSVRGAEKVFEQRVVLAGVDLELGAGEIYALLGPNGAGKTTLIRSICGRVALDAGTIRVGGADPRRDASVRRQLGLVPQEIALYAYLTVTENLEILGRLAGVRGARLEAAVAEALEWTGLGARARDRTALLSGGMRRRLNIAAGALHGPRALLLDEPTVGVDPSARDTVHEMLRQLRDRGVGVLITTHDMEQAEELADRIGIMVDGRICAEDTFAGLIRSTFGEAKVLTVRLAEKAGGEGRAILETLGLVVAADGKTWSGRWSGGLEALSELGMRMTRAGIEASDVRVHEPGLRATFFHVTGREFDS